MKNKILNKLNFWFRNKSSDNRDDYSVKFRVEDYIEVPSEDKIVDDSEVYRWLHSKTDHCGLYSPKYYLDFLIEKIKDENPMIIDSVQEGQLYWIPSKKALPLKVGYYFTLATNGYLGIQYFSQNHRPYYYAKYWAPLPPKKFKYTDHVSKGEFVWIPCDKEMPNEEGWYMVLCKDEKVRKVQYLRGIFDDGGTSIDNVAYWAPIPNIEFKED